ncbi:DHH family phosphoesterase [Caldicellulosiruptoraceae bacterium PP1]
MHDKSKELIKSDSKLYALIIFTFSIIIILYDKTIGLICLAIVLFYFIYNYRSNIKQRKRLMEYIENLTLNIDNASKDTLLKFPLPMMITEYTGEIVWYNNKLSELIGNQKLLGKNYIDYLPALYDAVKNNQNKAKSVEFMNNYFDVFISLVEIEGSKNEKRYLNLFYFVDISEQHKLLENLNNTNVVFGYLQIDNYDDVMNSSPEVSRSNIASEIERKVFDWFYHQIKTDIFITKYEKDKYLFVTNYESLERMKEKRFNILDQLKEINIYNRIIPTLSCGIGIRQTSIYQSYKDAKTALDMALSRGGDQVVIYSNNNYEFYGGKSKEIEKRSKVRSRVMAQTLKEIIKHSDRIFIIGHQFFDFDCLGSAIGVIILAHKLGKEAYIATSIINPSIEPYIESLKQNEKYHDVFINQAELLKKKSENSVLFVVDTQRPSYLDIIDSIDLFNKIVVIDHHRRATDWIENALINYSETYASSTSELISEILNYEGIRISKLEAEILMAGIYIDTKGFTKNTGVRTFEVITYLRENNADPLVVKEFFKEDFDTFIKKKKLIENTHIIFGNIAIVADYSHICTDNVIIAKVADEVLNIKGIDASFVICQVDDGVVISGRSNGKINVQLILEKLGGGGHLDTAGAQIININIDDAVIMLTDAINSYLNENQ